MSKELAAAHLARLVSFPHEAGAAAVVAALSEHGIRAESVGGFTAGFRAEAPGDVHIMVFADDLGRAQHVLAEIRAANRNFDWSNVNVGEPD
jgi:hypothetical protein